MTNSGVRDWVKTRGRIVAETDCPTCGAQRGDKCLTMSGGDRVNPHESRWELLDTPVCPTCFAPPGQPCAAASGRVSSATHVARRRAKLASRTAAG